MTSHYVAKTRKHCCFTYSAYVPLHVVKQFLNHISSSRGKWLKLMGTCSTNCLTQCTKLAELQKRILSILPTRPIVTLNTVLSTRKGVTDERVKGTAATLVINTEI